LLQDRDDLFLAVLCAFHCGPALLGLGEPSFYGSSFLGLRRLDEFIKPNVVSGSTIYTDGLKTFTGLPRVPLADRAIGTCSNGSSIFR
jgi:hypothetical protein